MGKSLDVLIVEDNPDDVELILHAIRRGGYDPDYRWVDNADALNSALGARSWEVILCDYALPHFSGLEALRAVREVHALDVPFIFISGAIGEEAAVTLMRAGAQDFVRKDNLNRIVAAIERELDAAETRRNRRQADERLELERRLLRQLMTAIPDAIYFKDRQHRFTLLNEAQCRILNVSSADDALGKTADAFLPPERVRIQHEDEMRIFADGEPLLDRTECGGGANGSIRWFSSTKAPLRDRHGEIVGLVGITRDVTDRRQHEQMKDEFVATVSHELRTPLTAVSAALGLITGANAAGLPSSCARMVEIAHTNCERLVRLVNDILYLQKIETGKLPLDLRPADARDLVEQAIEAMRDYSEGYDVLVRMDDDAPPAMALVDADRLVHAVTNLLSNAIKFSPRGAEVLVTTEDRGSTIRISVRDCGPGIPDAYRERIFEKFVQVDATDARRRGGTGLGLPIVKQIVALLGGRVDFESAPGGGTVFYIELPATRQSAPDRTSRSEAPIRIAS